VTGDVRSETAVLSCSSHQIGRCPGTCPSVCRPTSFAWWWARLPVPSGFLGAPCGTCNSRYLTVIKASRQDLHLFFWQFPYNHVACGMGLRFKRSQPLATVCSGISSVSRCRSRSGRLTRRRGLPRALKDGNVSRTSEAEPLVDFRSTRVQVPHESHIPSSRAAVWGAMQVPSGLIFQASPRIRAACDYRKFHIYRTPCVKTRRSKLQLSWQRWRAYMGNSLAYYQLLLPSASQPLTSAILL
jgi:hypothetical protein